jgi:glycosyltransferase involved in cell wall biosynthesis
MNILFLSDAVYADKPGGSRVVAREAARLLVERGHRVTLLVARQVAGTPDEECVSGVRVVRYAGAGNARHFVGEGRAMAARLARDTPFDIVHTHFAYAAHGPVRALPPDAIHVRTFYGPWDGEGYVEDTARLEAAKNPAKKVKFALQRAFKKRMKRRIEAQSLQRSGAIIVLSEHSRREALEYGVAVAKLHRIVGGVDTARFGLPSGSKKAAREALGLPLSDPILLSVRRLAPRMGLNHLISAMPAVVAAHPRALLLIGGQGTEQSRLEKQIASLHLEKNVRLLGFVPENELATYYGAADLFVLPSIALEGFGLVTVEALACGTPALGTQIGATPEILGALDKRLLTPSADERGLSSGILDFLGNSWRDELSAERLHDFVLQNYSWERHVDGLENIYRDLLKKR